MNNGLLTGGFVFAFGPLSHAVDFQAGEQVVSVGVVLFFRELLGDA
ncbi:hypothetical protein ACFQUU_21815 [Herbaspirillum sp. GCM10030257]